MATKLTAVTDDYLNSDTNVFDSTTGTAYTDDTRPGFSGTVDVAAKSTYYVEVYDGNNRLGGAQVDNNANVSQQKNWNIGEISTFDTMGEGSHTITVYTYRWNGFGWSYLSSEDASYTVVVDRTDPGALIISLEHDNGVSSSDKTTNDPTLKFTGKEDGATVQYKQSNGNWSTTAPTFSDGSNKTVTVRQVDKAGNAGSESTLTFTLDRSAPAKLGLSLKNDRGTSTNDRVTNDATLNITGAESDGQVQYKKADGSWTTDAPTIIDGVDQTVTIRQMDKAGNYSPETSLTFTLDRSAPAKLGLSLKNDKGTDTNDRVTNDATLNITGAESDGQVQYKKADGSWTTDAPTIIDGVDQTVTIRQMDKAGNYSPETSLTFTLDRSAPAMLGLSLKNDKGTDTNDRVTNDATLNITGAESDGQVQYKKADGTWTKDAPPITDGVDQTVTIRQMDKAGNYSPETTLTFTLDRTDPAKLGLSLKYDNGPSNTDNVTNDATLNITGAESDGQIQYKKADGTWTKDAPPITDGVDQTVTVRQMDKAGNYSPETTLTFTLDRSPPAAPTVGLTHDTGSDNADKFTNNPELTFGLEDGGYVEYLHSDGFFRYVKPPVGEGTQTLTIRQVDKAGNVSTPIDFTFTLDTSAPSAVTASLVTDSGSPDGLTNDGALKFAGQEADAKIQYKVDGEWQDAAPSLKQGTNELIVRQVDKAGNEGPESAFSFDFDDENPDAVTASLVSDTGPVGDDRVTSDGTLKFAGKEDGAKIQYKVGADWQDTAPSLVQGLNTLTIRQVDKAGNNGPESTFAFTYDNVKPTVTSNGGGNVVENVSTSDVVYKATANDATTAVKFSLTGADATKFTIDASTGEVRFVTSPDYEKPHDAGTNNKYNFNVIATDLAGNVSATKAVELTVTDKNEAPTADVEVSVNVAESAGTLPALADIHAKDPDAQDIFTDWANDFEDLTYTITSGNESGLFSVIGGKVYLNAGKSLDFESKKVHELTIVTKDGPGLSTTSKVTINVTDVAEAPVFNDGLIKTVSMDEGGTFVANIVASDPDTPATPHDGITYEIVTGSILSPDAAKFTIDANGQLSFVSPADYEARLIPIYTVQVKATDKTGLSSIQQVIVTLKDANDAPTAANVTVTKAENIAVGAEVATVVGKDVDTKGNWGKLSYEISGGNEGGLFVIDAATGKITLAGKLDYETATSHTLKILTKDGGGASVESTVTVNVTDVNDVAPKFDAEGKTGSVNENDNTTVVFNAHATDNDKTPDFQVIEYSLSGDDAGLFNISQTTGEITFKDKQDFENKGDANKDGEYKVTVRAQDKAGNFDSRELTITVKDVNDEKPVFTSGATASVNENVTGPVYTATTTDADTNPDFKKVTYSLATGGDNDLFTIDATTGAVSFKSAPDFENPLSVSGNNNYVITVKATDGVNAADDKQVTISVTDVFELPANADVVITTPAGYVNTASPTITGFANTSMAGLTITLLENGVSRGQAVIQANGSWTITSSSVGSDGDHSFTAQVAGLNSNSVNLTVDTVAPTVTITGTTGTGSAPLVNGTVGIADAGRVVQILENGTVVGTGTVAANGTFSVNVSLTGTGVHNLVASVTDLAGNTGTGTGSHTVAVNPNQGQADAANLVTAYENIMDNSVQPKDVQLMTSLQEKLVANTITFKEALSQLVDLADATTSVATMSYQFFTGKIPTKAGLDFLVAINGSNPNNLNSAYYQGFNMENRYINFAVNLGHDGDGRASFQANYGSMTLFDATKKAYAEIFGSANATDTKIHDILDAAMTVNGLAGTRAAYFASYGHDDIGTKAAMVGWLLAEAAKADVGKYALANEAFLTDLADGANFNVDLIGTYPQSSSAGLI